MSSPIKPDFHSVNFAVDANLTLYETVCVLKELTFSKSKINQLKINTENTIYSTEKLKKITGFRFSHPELILERWVNRLKENGLIDD